MLSMQNGESRCEKKAQRKRKCQKISLDATSTVHARQQLETVGHSPIVLFPPESEKFYYSPANARRHVSCQTRGTYAQHTHNFAIIILLIMICIIRLHPTCVRFFSLSLLLLLPPLCFAANVSCLPPNWRYTLRYFIHLIIDYGRACWMHRRKNRERRQTMWNENMI